MWLRGGISSGCRRGQPKRAVGKSVVQTEGFALLNRFAWIVKRGEGLAYDGGQRR